MTTEIFLLFISAYICGAFIVTSILMWWFNTNLPVHIFEIIRYIGFRKKDDDYWSIQIPLETSNFTITQNLKTFTFDDLITWISQKTHPKLGELASCPGCLSFHISFWSSILVSCCLIFLHMPISYTLFFALVSIFGWPSIGNILLKKMQHS